MQKQILTNDYPDSIGPVHTEHHPGYNILVFRLEPGTTLDSNTVTPDSPVQKLLPVYPHPEGDYVTVLDLHHPEANQSLQHEPLSETIYKTLHQALDTAVRKEADSASEDRTQDGYGPPIADFTAAFDTVVPGYAHAWNKTTSAAVPEHHKHPDLHVPTPWDERPGESVNFDQDRCLPLYAAQHLTRFSYDLQNLDLDVDPRTYPLPALLLYNRGYVPVCLATFDNPATALNDLHQLGAGPTAPANNRRHFIDEDHHERWFTDNTTPYNTRCDITLKILAYLKNNARQIIPLWNHAGDLARQS